MKKKINKKKGILFWITGLSGSGKSSVAKKIYPTIEKNFGPTILCSGDDLRLMFNLKKFDRNSRLKYSLSFSKFAKFITNQGINLALNVIAMFEEVRKKNEKEIENYVEIYIKKNLKKVLNKSKKKIYKKYSSNLVGKDIIAQLPKKPLITIENNFNRSLNQISLEALRKINNTLK